MTQQTDKQDLRKWGKEYGEKLNNLSNISNELVVDIAKKVGGFLGKKNEDNADAIDLKMNQIRRFLVAARKIETEIKSKSFEAVSDTIVLLRPKLAYAAGREQKVVPLMNVLDPAIKSAAQSRENFKKFLKLIESIIAFHKYYGGKND